jgi:hypothetical protein
MLFETQTDRPVVVIFRAAAAIAIAGQEIQVSVRTFDDVSQA